MTVQELLSVLMPIAQGGGNLALCVCAVFIYRASERLARIEKALDRYMMERNYEVFHASNAGIVSRGMLDNSQRDRAASS